MNDYDDDKEVTRIVWDHYQSLMTDFERRVGRAIIARQKAASQHTDTARFLNEKWGGYGDPEIESALLFGADHFRSKVSKRLLEELPAETLIRRCPNCQRVVRTPKAQQCFWCGHDWH